MMVGHRGNAAGAPAGAGFIGTLGSVRRNLFKGFEGIVFVLLVALLAMVSTQVFTRYVVHVSINWIEEASRMIMIWVIMLGASIAADRGEHYVISVVFDRLPAAVRLPLLLLTNLLAVAFLVFLVREGWTFFQSGFTRYYVSLDIPRAVVFFAVPAGAAAMIFSIVSRSLEAWATRRTPPRTTDALVSAQTEEAGA